MEFSVLETFKKGSHHLRKEREKYYINKFNTKIKGLNKDIKLSFKKLYLNLIFFAVSFVFYHAISKLDFVRHKADLMNLVDTCIFTVNVKIINAGQDVHQKRS